MFKNRDRKKEDNSDGFAPDDDFEKILREMEKIVGNAFKTSISDWESKEADPDELPVRVNSDEEYRAGSANYYEPSLSAGRAADIIETDLSVSVTLQMPEAKKKDIYLEVSEHVLEVHVDSLFHPYYKKIDMPSEVKPGTTKATYKNGVLDIEIRKKIAGKTGHRVDIR